MLSKKIMLILIQECIESYDESKVWKSHNLICDHITVSEFGYIKKFEDFYVFCVRGTDVKVDLKKGGSYLTLLGWARNFNLFPVTCNTTKGFYKGYSSLIGDEKRSKIFRSLMYLLTNDKKVYITGHSRGCPIAATIYVRLKEELEHLGKIQCFKNIENCLFSPPRFLRNPFLSYYTDLRCVYVKGDIVTKIPPFFYKKPLLETKLNKTFNKTGFIRDMLLAHDPHNVKDSINSFYHTFKNIF